MPTAFPAYMAGLGKPVGTLTYVATWFARRRPLAELPRLKPRSERSPVARVDLHDLTPDPSSYLGQAAYLQLVSFQALSSVITADPSLADKQRLAAPAASALEKYEAFTTEIHRRDGDPLEVMAPFTRGAERLYALVQGADWIETLLAVLVTSGLLEDFFIRVSGGLPADLGLRSEQILLTRRKGDDGVLEVLRSEIERDSELTSRLAVWGRRLVGDTLLIARSVLRGYDRLEASEEREIEPIFTELIADHTRRMDSLGLTA
jgi:hypothetical protein